MASSTMTRTQTSTATKVLVGAALAGSAAYGFMMLGDSGSSDPVNDPSTIQYCRNKCIVAFGDSCLEREGARCIEFVDGRCVARERTESCDAQGRACWDACDRQFAEAPGYLPPGYVPPGGIEMTPGYMPPGYVPPTYMDEVPVGYLVPGYTPAGYVPPTMEEPSLPLEMTPGYVWPGEIRKEDMNGMGGDGMSGSMGATSSRDTDVGSAPTSSDSSAGSLDEYLQMKLKMQAQIQNENAQPPQQEPPKKEEYYYQAPADQAPPVKEEAPAPEPQPEKQSFFDKLFK